MASLEQAYNAYCDAYPATMRAGMTAAQYSAANFVCLNAHAVLEDVCRHAIRDESDQDVWDKMEGLLSDIATCGGDHAPIFEEIRNLVEARSRKDSHSNHDSD